MTESLLLIYFIGLFKNGFKVGQPQLLNQGNASILMRSCLDNDIISFF